MLQGPPPNPQPDEGLRRVLRRLAEMEHCDREIVLDVVDLLGGRPKATAPRGRVTLDQAAGLSRATVHRRIADE